MSLLRCRFYSIRTFLLATIIIAALLGILGSLLRFRANLELLQDCNYNLLFTFPNGDDRLVLYNEPIPWNFVLFGSVTNLELATKYGFFENEGLNASANTRFKVPPTVKEMEVGNLPIDLDLTTLLASYTQLEEVHIYHSVVTKSRIRELSKLTTLRKIKFYECYVEIDGLSRLGELDNLVEIEFWGSLNVDKAIPLASWPRNLQKIQVRTYFYESSYWDLIYKGLSDKLPDHVDKLVYTCGILNIDRLDPNQDDSLPADCTSSYFGPVPTPTAYKQPDTEHHKLFYQMRHSWK